MAHVSVIRGVLHAVHKLRLWVKRCPALRRAGSVNADQETIRDYCVDDTPEGRECTAPGLRGQVPIRHLPLAPRCANVTSGAVQSECEFEWLPRRPRRPPVCALVPWV